MASCAELSFITDMPEVKITTMTAAEFVGHTDDIGSKYDMIYIGDQKNNDPNTDTDLLTRHQAKCVMRMWVQYAMQQKQVETI